MQLYLCMLEFAFMYVYVYMSLCTLDTLYENSNSGVTEAVTEGE